MKNLLSGHRKMKDLTEEEADVLDEELTRNTPRVDFSKPDIFCG